MPEFCPPPDHCICNGAGFFRVQADYDHRWFGKAHPCICTVQKQQNNYRSWLWEEARIPERYMRKSINEFDATHEGNRKAKDAAVQFITGAMDTPWLAIVGIYGNGKTHLATAIIRAFVLREIYAIYGFVPDVLKELRRGFENKTYFAVLDSWKKAPILALDDLGRQQDTDWIRAELEELIDHRYREGLPTVITSNRSIEGTATEPGLSQWSPAIARRLNDYRTCTLVINNAPEYGTVSVLPQKDWRR